MSLTLKKSQRVRLLDFKLGFGTVWGLSFLKRTPLTRIKGTAYFFSSTSLTGLIWYFMGLFLHSSLEFVPFTTARKQGLPHLLLLLSTSRMKWRGSWRLLLLLLMWQSQHTVRINKSWSSSGCSREKLDSSEKKVVELWCGFWSLFKRLIQHSSWLPFHSRYYHHKCSMYGVLGLVQLHWWE